MSLKQPRYMFIAHLNVKRPIFTQSLTKQRKRSKLIELKLSMAKATLYLFHYAPPSPQVLMLYTIVLGVPICLFRC